MLRAARVGLRRGEGNGVVLVRNLGIGCGYDAVHAMQQELHAERCKATLEKVEVELRPPDVALLVEHEPVFTLGRGASLDNLKFDPSNHPDVVLRRVERGGQVTYHGPGQVVLYPILCLDRYRRDIRWFVDRVEATVVRLLETYGLQGVLDRENPGVWVDGAKVAAVGIAMSGWVSYHGLSINVTDEVYRGFDQIVPCGLQKPVTCLQSLLPSSNIEIEDVKLALLDAFSKEFQVELDFEEMDS